MPERAAKASPRMLGRYLLFGEIASGGMATVHIGRLIGPVGFSRTVAIKKLHPQFAKDPEFVSMFLDEARLAARIRHPNVVSTLDVVALEGELFLVMDYVQGASLSQLFGALFRAKQRMPPQVVSGIVIDTLLGLHAAHEATNDHGHPLGIVHRDISPQNVLVGADGIARVVDFGVAKAASRAQTTRDGQLKGKLSYMAPEQLKLAAVDRRTDVFAVAIVLWEALAGRRLFAADDTPAIVARILTAEPDPPSRYAPGIPSAVEDVVMRGLAKSPASRFASAREMARALDKALPRAGSLEIGEWVASVASELLKVRHERLAEVESASVGPFELPAESLSDSSVTIIEDPARSSGFGARVESLAESSGADSSLSAGRKEPRSSSTDLSLVSTPMELPKPRSRIRWIAAALSAAALLALAVAGALGAFEDPAAPSAVAAPVHQRTLHAGLAASSASRAVRANPLVSPPALTAPATPAPVSSAAAPQASAAAPAPALRRTSLPKPSASRPRKRACNPPYVLNADGSKRFKPECF
jgi:serine/threonine-protein kinase